VVAAIVGALLLTGAIGAKKVRVPNVVNIDQASAAKVLHRDGLNVHFTFVTSKKPRGTTFAQDPDPGTQVKKDTTVDVSVSSGPGDGQVPPVAGLTRLAARRALTAAGYKIHEHREYSTSDPAVAPGHVTRTLPDTGTTLEIGRFVELYISRGPPDVDVPDVTNQQLSDARSTLTGDGFRVTTVDKQTTDADPGTVLAQSPASGGQAPKGSTITLTVAKAPDQVDVPDETGKLADHASIDLQRAGFIVQTQAADTTDPAEDGRVISQDPPGNGKAKPKSTVTLVVGHYAGTDTTQTTSTTETTAP
jgi:beta-lactam-binding protein with PASTA domain